MRIRGYRTGDVEAMFLLDVACFSAPYQFDREMMLEVAEAPNAFVVVIEEDGAMLGFVIAHIQGKGGNWHAYIVTIDVAPSSRRRGLGAMLLQHAESQAKAAGVHSIGLHVAVDNAAAISFYQCQGYDQIGREGNFYSEARTDAFVYVKPL